MAASGRSMFSLNWCSRCPTALPSRSIAATYDGVTLKSTASIIEQRKETPIASAT